MYFSAYNLILKLIFTFGASFFSLLINYYYWIEYCPSYICNPFKNMEYVYDYIIVGAGTAGSVMALRLAEQKDLKILLLEAGPTGGSILDVPSALALLQLTYLDWKYETIPQQHASKAFKNNATKWPRGKVFGGSGRFNNMLYVRGHERNFRKWFENQTDFNYENDVMHYLKKSERQIGRFKNDVKFHGQNGFLVANDIPFVTELAQALLNAANILGFPVTDINGGDTTGFMIPQANIINGKRYSTAHHLLLHKPENLELLTNTLAIKILFRNNFEARAINVEKFGVKKVLRASKGIILTAGTVETPKLLMLSGIGPKQHLKKLKIKNIVDLPVGENLQDHVGTGLDLFTINKPLALNPLSLLSPSSFYDYIKNGKGPWTSIQCEVLSILLTKCLYSKNVTKCSEELNEAPDLQLMALPMGITTDNGAHLRNIIDVTDNTWDNYLQKLLGTPTISIAPIVLQPKSIGYLKLASKDYHDKPLINPRYLSDKEDIQVLIKGIGFVRKLMLTDPIKKLGIKLNDIKFPLCHRYDFDSDKYWECYIRHLTLTIYHPVGTAKMGHSSHKDTVVDFNFKVLHVNKLFIADASVIPVIPSANTNAAVVFMAEKAADSIKYHRFLNEHTCLLVSYLFFNHRRCL